MPVHTEPPENFDPKFEVVSAHLDVGGELLFLQTNPMKTFANMWGVPAGKINSKENKLSAIKRELFEETKIDLDEGQFNFFKTVYIDQSPVHFIYHIFHVKLDEKPGVNISNEHSKFVWSTPQNASSLSLIPDEYDCLKLLFDF
ncbi:MAG: NUDIX domain-containing protein [Candidatus Diapherotrites archaeon]|jgi:8-oxo-dGTP pyrophosphatase MutT (NUDIX family)|uniref:8-oxo-dGTP diphosphatase n=1 Tax=Candidatus Iainarchaeum sp. TaxID=3101447 RepID=A0A8T5GDD8_9ARCH|nr:NUDIX domain-containing protein [Candidatus Diapherotrites archaeon]